VLALVDPRSHTVCFASAGHWPPLVARGVGTPAAELESDAAFPLGVAEDTQFPSTTVELGPEPFVLFCYTDGVSEALDSAGQPFGRERLLQALAERTDLNPNAIVKHVRKQVTGFVGPAEQSDDLTMLAVWVA
jgi:sigma-B regulation protein RsbU (phosphoserine phosphatase)